MEGNASKYFPDESKIITNEHKRQESHTLSEYVSE